MPTGLRCRVACLRGRRLFREFIGPALKNFVIAGDRLFRFGPLHRGRDGSKFRIFHYLFDDLFREGRGSGCSGFGQKGTGDLKAVKQEARPAGIDLVVGDFVQDLPDRELQTGTLGEVSGRRKGEGVAFRSTSGIDLRLAGPGATGEVMVITEMTGAERR